MRIGFIGAGRAGTSLALYLADYGFTVTGFYSKTYDAAVRAAKEMGTNAYKKVDALCDTAEMIVISVPDDAIHSVAASITTQVEGKYFIHISGAHESSILECIKRRGGMVASIHPAYTFPARFEKPPALQFVAEGDAAVLRLFSEKGLSVLPIAAADKPLYHAAAVFASNYVTVLEHTATKMLEKIGFPTMTAQSLFSVLSHAAVDAAAEKGAKNALTGPMARGDEKTIRMHLAALNDMPAEKEFYKVLAREITKMRHIPHIDTIKELIE